MWYAWVKPRYKNDNRQEHEPRRRSIGDGPGAAALMGGMDGGGRGTGRSSPPTHLWPRH